MSDVTNEYEPAPATQPVMEERRSSRGCLYGCLFVVVAGIAMLVCGGVATYWWVASQVEKYTSATPVELPTVEYTDEQLAELESRVNAFNEAFERGETPKEDLVLSAEEINALIAREEELRGKVFVRIEDGQVSGDVSIPTPDAIPGGKGRYFNGSASFDVSMDNGVLIVTLVDAEVNDEPLPEEFIEAMANQNLAKDVYKDAETSKVLRQFESISVEGDKIILKVKRDETAEAAGDETAESPPEDTSQQADADAAESQDEPSAKDPTDEGSKSEQDAPDA